MKKILLIAAALAVVSSAAQAQITWGLKGGLNISCFSNSDEIVNTLGIEGSSAMKTGIYAGGFMEWRFARILALQPELYYSRQGTSFVDKPTDDLTVRYRIRANYLNLPIMVKIYPLKSLSIEVGPQISYALTAKLFEKGVDTEEGAFSGIGYDKEVDHTKFRLKGDSYNAFDFGVAMGVTYQFKEYTALSARYYLGLGDFNKDNKFGASSLQNRVIQVGLEFRY